MRLIPSDLAAMALRVDQATIRQWIKRGKLTRHGTARRTLIDLDECHRLDEARRRDGDTRAVQRVA